MISSIVAASVSIAVSVSGSSIVLSSIMSSKLGLILAAISGINGDS